MRKYKEKLIDKIIGFTENMMVAFFLQLLCLLYPFLADCVSGFRSALVIHISEELEMTKVVNYVRGFSNLSIAMLGDAPKRFEQALQVPEYSVLIVEYSKSRYTAQNIEQLISFCHRAALEEEILPLVLVLTDRPISVCLEQFAGPVYLHELPEVSYEDADEFARYLIQTVISSQNLISNRIMQSAIDKEVDIGIFRAASICLQTVLECSGVDSEHMSEVFDLMDAALASIRHDWGAFGDPEFFVGVFRQRFIGWINDVSSEELLVLDRRRIEGRSVGRIDEAILYDDDCYYLSYEMFQDICAPIAKELGLSYIKEQLELAGLVDCEGASRTYYTKKCEAVNAYGEVRRLRRVKIWREMLDDEEDLSFLELILSKGGEDYDYGKDWHDSSSKKNRICLGESE